MTLFSFHVTGHGASGCDVVSDCESQHAAHQEAVAICSDLARDAFKKIAPNAEWQMTVTDDTGKTVFRFRICEDKDP
jgi:hypothetical protein